MDNLLDSIDSELVNLDAELARERERGAPGNRLRLLARMDWSAATAGTIQEALADHDAAIQARAGAREKLEAAAEALRVARRAFAALKATPATRERTVSHLVAAELAAAAAAVSGAVAMFHAARTDGEPAIAEGQA